MTSWRSAVRVSYIPNSCSRLDSDTFLVSLRKRLAFLLAKAGCEVFPDAQVVAIEGTSAVFFADFCFTQTFDPAFLALVEDRFRSLVKQNPSLQVLELVTASARGLLERSKQGLQAARLPSHPQMLVEVGLLDEFALLIPEDIKCDSDQKFFWELLGVVDGGSIDGDPVVRLMGIACEDLDSLKTSKKFWARNPYIPPAELAIQGRFLAKCEENWIWLPRGETVRQAFLQSWQKLVLGEGYRLVSTGGNFPFEKGLEELIASLKGEELKFAEAAFAAFDNGELQEEGLLTPAAGWTDRLVRICPKDRTLETCISSLQFILQIPRILSFEAQIVLCSSLSGDAKELRKAADAAGVDYRNEIQTDRSFSSIDVRISDRLGRWWTVSSLWIAKGQPIPGHRAVYASCFGKWERLLGLIIEREEIELEPFIQKLNSKLAVTGSTL